MKYQMDCSSAILPQTASFASPWQEESFKQSCQWYLHPVHTNLRVCHAPHLWEYLISGNISFPTFSFLLAPFLLFNFWLTTWHASLWEDNLNLKGISSCFSHFSGHIWTLSVKDLVMKAKNFWIYERKFSLCEWGKTEASLWLENHCLDVRERYIHHPWDKRFPGTGAGSVCVCVFVHLCMCMKVDPSL